MLIHISIRISSSITYINMRRSYLFVWVCLNTTMMRNVWTAEYNSLPQWWLYNPQIKHNAVIPGDGRRAWQRAGWQYCEHPPCPKLSCHCPPSDYYPGMRGLKVVSRRLPTPLLRAYVCKSDLYLNIIDFRPPIRYRERVSYCVRLISMAFLSAEHDKCIWEIKCCGWVRSPLGAWARSAIQTF